VQTQERSAYPGLFALFVLPIPTMRQTHVSSRFFRSKPVVGAFGWRVSYKFSLVMRHCTICPDGRLDILKHIQNSRSKNDRIQFIAR